MDELDVNVVYILFGVFLFLLSIGATIIISLAVSALMATFYLGENPIKFVQVAFTSVGAFPLMALPSFILAGSLMQASGLSRRLIGVAESLTGSFTGGISAATILACLFFGAISGSGPATTAAVGMIMIPAMIQRGYGKGYAAAVTASAGGLGIIVPPSIPMVIFGISAMGMLPPPEAVEKFGEFQSVTIGKMFIAGFVPAIIMASCMLIRNYFTCKKRGFHGTGEELSVRNVGVALKEGFWAVLAPFIILGGIYSGFFTPTEAAVVAIFYTLFVGIFIYKELSWNDINESLLETTWIIGRILLILFGAIIFGRVLVENQVPAIISEALLSWTDNIYLIWLILIAFLLFVGMFMETLALIMILVPVMLPIAYGVGMDPIHFGIVMICALSIGFQTPPLGENLFVASGITGVDVERISLRALPFAFTSVIALLIIAFVPELTLWLPGLLSKGI